MYKDHRFQRLGIGIEHASLISYAPHYKKIQLGIREYFHSKIDP